MGNSDAGSDERDPSRHLASQQDDRTISRRKALASIASVGLLGLAGWRLRSGSSGVKPLWERNFEAASTVSPPAGTDEHVVVGGQDKQLHGLTAGGDRLFTVGTGGPIETRPVVPKSGGPVHVHSTDGDLYTVGLSGELLWRVEGQAFDGWLGRQGSFLVSVDPVADVIAGYDAREGTRRFQRSAHEYPFPTLSDSACLFPATNPDGETKLVALAPTSGEVLWESSLRGGYPSVVAGGDRLVTVCDSTVRMRRASDGHILWRTAVAGDVTSHFGPPLWVGEHVYVRAGRDDRPDEFVAIDRDSGSVQWRRSVGYELETVTTTSQGVFVASSVDDPDGGILIRLDAFTLDGTRQWQTTTDVTISGTVAALGRAGSVLFVASDHEIEAYDPNTGARRWQYDPQSRRIGVTAADSALYVSHTDNGGIARLPTS